MAYWNGGFGSGVLKSTVGNFAKGVGNLGTAVGIDDENKVAQIGRNILDPKKSYKGNVNPVRPATQGKVQSANTGQDNSTVIDDTPPTPTSVFNGSSNRSSSDSTGAELAYYDNQSSLLRDMLSRTQTALNQGLTGLSDSYNREVGGANTQRSRALENYDVQRQDTTRAKQEALGQVDTNARVLNDSLKRILGMASGSDSSAYNIAAPNAVARQASGERGEVLSDHAENDRNIALAEKRATEDFASLLEDLSRQRGQREQELRSGVLEQEQGINRNLADVAAEKARAQGLGYGAAMAMQQPYAAAVNERQGQLDSLFERFRSPTLTARPVEVQTPQLRDYMVDRAGINATAQGGQQQYTPYSNFLRKPDDELLA